MESALQSALLLYRLVKGICSEEELFYWRQSRRKSLASGFLDAYTAAIQRWNDRMADCVKMNRIALATEEKQAAKEFEGLLSPKLTWAQIEWMSEQLINTDYLTLMRLHLYFGTAMNDESERMKAFGVLRETLINAAGYGDVKKGESSFHAGSTDND